MLFRNLDLEEMLDRQPRGVNSTFLVKKGNVEQFMSQLKSVKQESETWEGGEAGSTKPKTQYINQIKRQKRQKYFKKKNRIT